MFSGEIRIAQVYTMSNHKCYSEHTSITDKDNWKDGSKDGQTNGRTDVWTDGHLTDHMR